MKEDEQLPVARLSSTLVLLRERAGLEVLMVARHHEIDFASGAMVFPGGKVTEDDYRDEWTAHVDGNYGPKERAARIGGIREAFEESGLLLARSADAQSHTFVGPDVCKRLAPHRGPVDRCEESFLDLIRENGLVLCLDALTAYAHWITPDFMPKRFDTHFYVAVAPEGQLASHDGRETTEAVWVEPRHVLEQERAGKATLLFPTRVNLERLEDLGDLRKVLETAAAQTPVTVLPKVRRDDTSTWLEIPKEAGYRVTREPFDIPRR